MTDSPALILYVNSTSFMTGAEYSLLDLMTNLDHSKYQPLLLVPSPGLFSVFSQEASIPVEFLKSIPPPGGLRRDTYRTLFYNTVVIAQLIKQFGINLVHANSPRTAYHSGLGARLAGIPHITHVRDYSSSPFYSYPKAYFLNVISDRFIIISKAIRLAISKHKLVQDQKIRLIYNAIPSTPQFDLMQKMQLRAEFGMSNRSPLLAVIGYISRLKGQEIVIQALPSILTQYPDTRLLLVGQPNDADGLAYLSRLKELTRSLGLEEHVIFTGFRNDVLLILASIDCLIHAPVLPEAFGRVLLEASAVETPIIAADIGGIGEIVLDGETGLLVKPGQPADITEAVYKLLSDRNLCTRLGHAAGVRVRTEFTISRHISQIQSVYAELLS
jgi:glycosyltransferase involved in cell wall biosynthesis